MKATIRRIGRTEVEVILRDNGVVVARFSEAFEMNLTRMYEFVAITKGKLEATGYTVGLIKLSRSIVEGLKV